MGDILSEITSTASKIGDWASGISPTGVASSALSFVGGLMGNSQSAASAASAQEFSAQQFATRYQTTVKDLEAAGLSPMLAYSQGGGSPPTGVSYQAQNPFAGVGSAYQSGASGDIMGRKYPYEAVNLEQSAELAASQKAAVDASVDKIKADTGNVNADTDRIKAVVGEIAQHVALMKSQGDQADAQKAYIAETLKKVKVETELLNFEKDATIDTGNLARLLAPLGPLAPFAGLALQAFGLHMKGKPTWSVTEHSHSDGSFSSSSTSSGRSK